MFTVGKTAWEWRLHRVRPFAVKMMMVIMTNYDDSNGAACSVLEGGPHKIVL